MREWSQGEIALIMLDGLLRRLEVPVVIVATLLFLALVGGTARGLGLWGGVIVEDVLYVWEWWL